MRELCRESVVLRASPRRPPLLPLLRQRQLLPGSREKRPGRRALHGERASVPSPQIQNRVLAISSNPLLSVQ